MFYQYDQYLFHACECVTVDGMRLVLKFPAASFTIINIFVHKGVLDPYHEIGVPHRERTLNL